MVRVRFLNDRQKGSRRLISRLMQWFAGTFLSDDSCLGGQLAMGAHLLDAAAVRFGASIFTTMRVYEQQLDHPRSQFSAHCDRLAFSLRAFNWQPPDWTSIYEGCQQLIAHYPVIRITLFPDGKEWITGRALPSQLATWQQAGITGWLAPPTYARSLPQHKTGNYLACWLARQQAQKHGGEEAILTNHRGDWLETATGNLWGWADGQWWTPLAGDSIQTKTTDADPAIAQHLCLPGLMRNRILKILGKQGQPVNGQVWRQELVSEFDAIAYTNCVVELVPIHTILYGRTTLEYNTHHASLKALRQWLATSW